MTALPRISISFSPAPVRELLESVPEEELLPISLLHADADRPLHDSELRSGAGDILYTQRARLLFDVVSGWELEQMALFVEAMENRPTVVDNGVADDFRYRIPMRITERSPLDWHMEVPEELQTAWKSYYGHETFVETAAELDAALPWADAAVHLYGAMDWKEFLAMVRRRTGFFCRNRYLSDWLAYRITCRCQMANASGDLLYHRELVRPEDEIVPEDDPDGDLKPKAALELLDLTEGKPRYAPQNEGFLKWADPDWIEDTPGIARFREWAEETFDPLLMNILLRQTTDMVRMGARLPEVLAEFKSDGIDVDDEILAMLRDVCNDTRLWLNKGYTAGESLSKIVGKLGASSLDIRKKPHP